MDSLKDLLVKYAPEAPDEVLAIKNYIRQEFDADATVMLRGEILLISVGSASLANTLRLRLPQIQKVANTKRRILFRIA